MATGADIDLEVLKTAALATLKSKKAQKRREILAPRDPEDELARLRQAALLSKAQAELKILTSTEQSSLDSENADSSGGDREGSDSTSEVSLLEEVEVEKCNSLESEGEEESLAVPDILQDACDINDLLEDDFSEEVPPSSAIGHELVKNQANRKSTQKRSYSPVSVSTKRRSDTSTLGDRSTVGLSKTNTAKTSTTKTNAARRKDHDTSMRHIFNVKQTREVDENHQTRSSPVVVESVDVRQGTDSPAIKRKSTAAKQKRAKSTNHTKVVVNSKESKSNTLKKKAKQKHQTFDVVEVATIDTVSAKATLDVEVVDEPPKPVSKKSLKDRLGGYVRDKKSLKRHYMSNDQSSNSDLEDPVSQSHVKEDSPVQSKRGRRVTVDDDVTHDKVKLKLNIWSRIHKTESRSSRSSSSSRQEPPLRHSEVQEVGNSDPEYSALDDRSHKSSRVYSLAHSNKAHRVTVNDQRTPVSRKPKLEIWSRVDQEESKTSKSSSSLSHKPPSHSDKVSKPRHEKDLDERIRLIKEKNAKILERQREIEREKALFG